MSFHSLLASIVSIKSADKVILVLLRIVHLFFSLAPFKILSLLELSAVLQCYAEVRISLDLSWLEFTVLYRTLWICKLLYVWEKFYYNITFNIVFVYSLSSHSRTPIIHMLYIFNIYHISHINFLFSTPFSFSVFLSKYLLLSFLSVH